MTLTQTDAEIAEYILAHLSTIGFQTSTTMAEEIGVSDTSVIRFIRKLGFKGYADFRSEMNARTARQIDRAQPDLTPGEKYLRTLEHLAPQPDQRREPIYAEQSAKKLCPAGSGYGGADRGHSPAQRPGSIRRLPGDSLLCPVYGQQAPVPHPSCGAHPPRGRHGGGNLLDITERDCLFLYSFPRYSEIARPLMEIARESGAKVILMTDRRTSPLANKADVVVTAQVDGLGFTNSYVAPLSLSEVILLSVSGRKDVTDSKRFNRIDSVMEQGKAVLRKTMGKGSLFVNILAIESSCDETGRRCGRDGRTVLSNCIASQIEMHTIYGGVVPEIASRKHVEAVTGLADQAVDQAA